MDLARESELPPEMRPELRPDRRRAREERVGLRAQMSNHIQRKTRRISIQCKSMQSQASDTSCIGCFLPATCLLILLLLLQQTAEAQANLLNSLYLKSSSPFSSAQPLLLLTHQNANNYTTISPILKRQPGTSRQEESSGQRGWTSSVCQVRDGESVAIVEIEESRGTDMNQNTNPLELPISGSMDEIELRIESETHKIFHIQDKRLKLTRPLDRDAILKENSTHLQQQPITSIYLQISCLDKRVPESQDRSAQLQKQQRKKIIPVLVKVLDLNDNAPKFSMPVYNIQVDELTPVGAVILDNLTAIDLDSANNALVEYSLVGSKAKQQVAGLQQDHPNPRLVQRAQPLNERSSLMATTTISSSSPKLEQTTENSISTTTSSTRNLQDGQSGSTGFARSSKNEPTINLNSEPILNGPMEESDEEEESDESLLASLNSTSVEMESEADRARVPLIGTSGSSNLSGSRRKRRRRHLNKGGDGSLWTNIMAIGGLNSEELSQVNNSVRHADPDSTEYFSLEFAPGSNKPQIRLRKQLDYESRRVHVLQVVATDKATREQDRLSSLATVIVRVLDGDDQGPAFILEQSGCATGSFPLTTPSSLSVTRKITSHHEETSSNIATSLHSRVRRFSKGEGGIEAKRDQISVRSRANLPEGFKVTDENFDFSDMSSGDDADDEGENSSFLKVDPESAVRTRRLPPQAITNRRNGQLMTTVSPSESTQTGRLTSSALAKSTARYLDYTCLSSVLSVSSSGQAEYFSTVMTGDSDYLLRIAPQAIKATDRDELNAPIRYSFLNGTPQDFNQYFQINPLDASIKQVVPLEKNQLGKFTIWIEAQEQTANRLSSVARLTIEVVPTDKNPPVLVPNSYSGFIEENSPIGSNVATVADVNSRNYSNLLHIKVFDGFDGSKTGEMIGNKDELINKQISRSPQMYEFETTSDSFKVSKEGFVYVNKHPLDRDPPNQAIHIFQVTARQIGLVSSRSISSPISINVTLLDLNDNPPMIANSSLAPIQIAATSSKQSSRIISTIRGLDKDLAENARMLFSIYHVSNGGKDRFRLNEESGDLEAIGKFVAGEQFSLTLQVADELNRRSQGILEVLVVPGPNTGGPQFVVESELDNSRGYFVEINEGLTQHSAILQVKALDPENDPISYSIVDGNINNDFYINSKTGVIYVGNKLDREEVSAYNLLVQARDSGGLATNRPVNIVVSDINDENPLFARAQYSFQVEEGVEDKIIGQVSASDRDSGDNGKVTYQLEEPAETGERSLFSIDKDTGELRVLKALDYEQTKSHTLIVKAQDQGDNPRSTTTSVSIRVIDIQDESPYFERYHLEVKMQENLANHRVAQVQARDPDSVAKITYTIKSGDTQLFTIDEETGIISTIRGLDYEEAKAYTLLIGTVEEQSFNLDAANDLITHSSSSDGHYHQLDKSPICRVDVSVIDLNDNVPQFNSQLFPVRVQDSAELGSIVTKLTAEDRDGSEPNNQIRYELVESSSSSMSQQSHERTSSRCLQSFMIDPTSGAISIKSDLKRDSQSECQLVVRAVDLGQQPQSLSSTTMLTIFIDHIAEISHNSQIGFADSSFTVELAENPLANTLVKVLPIVNKPKINFPMQCEIISGNEQNRFHVGQNDDRDCELRTRDHQSIDYETKHRYILILRLNTIGGSSKTLAQVNINILDKNDNKPIFIQPSRYSQLTQQRFLAAVASDAPSETQVIQVRATDLDSPHANGMISYEILNDNEIENRFKIDPIDGIIRTSRPVEDIPSTRLPLRLRVLARDNPDSSNDALDSIAEVIVNLIDDKHRIALAFKDSPTGRTLDNKEEILSAIQERTGLIPGMEKSESLKILRNGTLEPDVSGTDFWFYLIEPGSFRIVSSDDSRIKSSLFELRSQNLLLDVLSQALGLSKARIRLPYGSSSRSATGVASSRSFSSQNRLSSALIVIALLIAIVSAIVVIYQCGSRSRYSKNRLQEKLYLPPQMPIPFYQPSFVCPKGPHSLSGNSQANYGYNSAFSTMNHLNQPSTPQIIGQGQQQRDSLHLNEQSNFQLDSIPYGKEYETQMLKMSVLFDDNNSVDGQNLNENVISQNNLS